MPFSQFLTFYFSVICCFLCLEATCGSALKSSTTTTSPSFRKQWATNVTHFGASLLQEVPLPTGGGVILFAMSPGYSCFTVDAQHGKMGYRKYCYWGNNYMSVTHGIAAFNVNTVTPFGVLQGVNVTTGDFTWKVTPSGPGDNCFFQRTEEGEFVVISVNFLVNMPGNVSVSAVEAVTGKKTSTTYFNATSEKLFSGSGNWGFVTKSLLVLGISTNYNSGTGQIMAFDRLSTNLIWTRPTALTNYQTGFSTASQDILIFFSGFQFLGVEAKTGREKWKVKGGGIGRNFLVEDSTGQSQRLFALNYTTLFAINVSNGKVLWSLSSATCTNTLLCIFSKLKLILVAPCSNVAMLELRSMGNGEKVGDGVYVKNGVLSCGEDSFYTQSNGEVDNDNVTLSRYKYFG